MHVCKGPLFNIDVDLFLSNIKDGMENLTPSNYITTRYDGLVWEKSPYEKLWAQIIVGRNETSDRQNVLYN